MAVVYRPHWIDVSALIAGPFAYYIPVGTVSAFGHAVLGPPRVLPPGLRVLPLRSNLLYLRRAQPGVNRLFPRTFADSATLHLLSRRGTDKICCSHWLLSPVIGFAREPRDRFPGFFCVYAL